MRVVIESFDDMGLKEDLLRGIYSYGFEKPSAIQQRAIKPLILMRDTIAQAQSGTGKTATFTIGAQHHEPLSATSLPPPRSRSPPLHVRDERISRIMYASAARGVCALCPLVVRGSRRRARVRVGMKPYLP